MTATATAEASQTRRALRAKTRLYCERFVFGKLHAWVASLAFLQPTHLDVTYAPLSLASPTAAAGLLQPSVACVHETVGCLRSLPAAACPSDKVRGM